MAAIKPDLAQALRLIIDLAVAMAPPRVGVGDKPAHPMRNATSSSTR